MHRSISRKGIYEYMPQLQKIFVNVTKVFGLEKQENWCIKYHMQEKYSSNS